MVSPNIYICIPVLVAKFYIILTIEPLVILHNILSLECDLFSVREENDNLISLLELQHEDFLEGHPS